MNDTLRIQLNRFQIVAVMLGAIGAVFCLVGAFTSPHQFFISYLFGYLFWLGLALGCFAIAMIHHLTSGRWGDVTRRFFEAGFLTMPALVILFIPIFFGLHDLYPWARPEQVAIDATLQKKHAYLNFLAFSARTIFFFGIWLAMVWLLRKWSLQQDRTTDVAPTRKLRALSGPGIVIYPLTATFAYVDWVMSLEPHWYSTLFPLIICIGQILSAFAFAILLLAWLHNRAPLCEVVTPTHFHHLGNLLLTFVLFWTYISFGQLLIIYSGNLPREIGWYLHRIGGNWKWIVGTLALFHFFLPFYLLLFRPIKKRASSLAILAGVVFVARIVDMFWLIHPTFFPSGISIHWLDFAAPIAVGGIWIAIFLAGLKRATLLPRNDPRMQHAPVHAY